MSIPDLCILDSSNSIIMLHYSMNILNEINFIYNNYQ